MPPEFIAKHFVKVLRAGVETCGYSTHTIELLTAVDAEAARAAVLAGDFRDFVGDELDDMMHILKGAHPGACLDLARQIKEDRSYKRELRMVAVCYIKVLRDRGVEEKSA